MLGNSDTSNTMAEGGVDENPWGQQSETGNGGRVVVQPVKLHAPLPPIPENTYEITFQGRGAMSYTAAAARVALKTQENFEDENFKLNWYLGERSTKHLLTFHQGVDASRIDGKSYIISDTVTFSCRLFHKATCKFKIFGLNPLTSTTQIKTMLANNLNLEKMKIEEIVPSIAWERVGYYEGPIEDIPHWLEVSDTKGYRQKHKIIAEGRPTVCHQCKEETHFPSQCPQRRRPTTQNRDIRKTMDALGQVQGGPSSVDSLLATDWRGTDLPEEMKRTLEKREEQQNKKRERERQHAKNIEELENERKRIEEEALLAAEERRLQNERAKRDQKKREERESDRDSDSGQSDEDKGPIDFEAVRRKEREGERIRVEQLENETRVEKRQRERQERKERKKKQMKLQKERDERFLKRKEKNEKIQRKQRGEFTDHEFDDAIRESRDVLDILNKESPKRGSIPNPPLLDSQPFPSQVQPEPTHQPPQANPNNLPSSFEEVQTLEYDTRGTSIDGHRMSVSTPVKIFTPDPTKRKAEDMDRLEKKARVHSPQESSISEISPQPLMIDTSISEIPSLTDSEGGRGPNGTNEPLDIGEGEGDR